MDPREASGDGGGHRGRRSNPPQTERPFQHKLLSTVLHRPRTPCKGKNERSQEKMPLPFPCPVPAFPHRLSTPGWSLAAQASCRCKEGGGVRRRAGCCGCECGADGSWGQGLHSCYCSFTSSFIQSLIHSTNTWQTLPWAPLTQ